MVSTPHRLYGQLLALHEQPRTRQEIPPFRWHTFLLGFLQPLRSSDFAYTLLSRCLVFLSFTLLGAYLFFYLSLVFHLSATAAAQEVTTFQLVSTGMLVMSALVAGYTAFLPLILSPVIGAVILNTFQRFAALFSIAALSSVLAAALIVPIKTVP